MSTSFIGKTELKAPKTTKPFSEKNVFSIAKAKTLLSSIQRRTIVDNIKNIINISEDLFKIFYENLITDFIEFVQILPVNNEARLASLMDEGLYRAYLALQEYKLDSSEDFDPLIAYVIFTTSLLFDIGCIIENRTVIICSKTGEFIQKWNPHQGPMQIEQGFYRIRRGGGTSSWSSRRLTVLFASLLMPIDGMAWIHNNSNVYNIWLALLNYDREGAGRFSIYLDRALDLLERYKLGNEFAAMPISPDLVRQSQGMEEAESFMEWLANAIKSGQVTINSEDSHAFLFKEGLLLTADILKKYGDSLSKDIAQETLLNQLKKLGVGEDKLASYISKAQAARSSGSLFSRTAMDTVGKDSSREFQQTKGATLTGLIINSLEVLGAQSGIVSPLAGYIRKMAQNATTINNSYPKIETKITQKLENPQQKIEPNTTKPEPIPVQKTLNPF